MYFGLIQYDPGSQQFDTSSKQRAPAYTDRILFKSKCLSGNSSSAFAGKTTTTRVTVTRFFELRRLKEASFGHLTCV